MVRLAKCLGVGFPNALNISLKLLLPRAYPGRAMFLRNLDALVAKQDGYPRSWLKELRSRLGESMNAEADGQ